MTLDITTLPFYKTIQTALEKPDFFSHGRVITFLLTYAYAHSTKQNKFMPTVLKGADMPLYETAIALDLRCQVAPVHGYDNVKEGIRMLGRVTTSGP
jgi:hypothetical protein